MIKTRYFLILVLLFSRFSVSAQAPVKTIPVKEMLTNDAAPPSDIMSREKYLWIRKILFDPLIPKAYRDSHTIKQDSPVSQIGYNYYDLIPNGSTTPYSTSSIFLTLLGGESKKDLRFNVSLSNDDARESENKIDWTKKAREWDAFIARNWKDIPLRRQTDWRLAIKMSGSSGLFRVEYAYLEQDVILYRVELNIRIADGMVGGFGGGSYKADLEDVNITPAPSRSEVIKALMHQIPNFQNSTIIRYVRYPEENLKSRVEAKKANYGFIIKTEIEGINSQKEVERVTATYNEDSKVVTITKRFTLKQNSNSGEPNRPYTTIADEFPSWSFDGKSLFFTTTREAKTRPFWSRASVLHVKSLAVATTAATDAEVTLLRPLKIDGLDLDGYTLGVQSPSGRYLAAGFDNGPTARLFILDLNTGTVHLPRKDWSRDKALDSILPPGDSWRGDGTKWHISSCAWLPGEKGLLLSLNRDIDLNLYIATWDKDKAPEALDLTPIVLDRGDDTLPCFSEDGQQLAWVHSTPVPNQNQQGLPLRKWELVVGEIDLNKIPFSVNTRNSIELPSAPNSVSWDKNNRRWLVAGMNYLIWVYQKQGTLFVEPANALSWEGMALTPTSASISSANGKIAVAAILENVRVYASSRSVVKSLIFEWDGHGSQVKPFYSPESNNLDLFNFPLVKRSWAEVSGDTSKYYIPDEVDHTTILPFKK